jgi:hypothetical protein
VLEKGVLSVISVGHGSGFLVDEAGIVITNNHVVNDAGKELMIRFGPGKVVMGKVVLQDRGSDLAVVLVNLKNLSGYTVLALYEPKEGEQIAYPGEKLFAIGSPISWRVLEKTLTEGIASKVLEDVIRHDVAINPGNSGGPLFNFDGKVIGVNTFIEQRDAGAGIAGSVSILKARPLIASVKQKLLAGELKPPSPELMPDYPSDFYPVSTLLRFDPSALPSRVLPYRHTGSDFEIFITTPVIGYKQQLIEERKQLQARAKRGTKKGFQVTDDEYASKNHAAYEDSLPELAPTIKITVVPKTKLTTGSKVAIGLAVLAAAGGVPVPVHTKREFKSDFSSLELVDNSGQIVCLPLIKGIRPYEALDRVIVDAMGSTTSMRDKTYFGQYEYDPTCFANKPSLAFRITAQGEKSTPSLIPVSATTQTSVVNDFKPYWEFKKKPSVSFKKR